MSAKSRINAWKPRLNSLGPGILLAAVSIGASHMIMSPIAGAKYEYKLVWLIIFTHLFKYYAFEFGPRFAASENMSLLEGYSRIKGPKNWALYLVLINTTIEGIAVAGAVITITASILYAGFGMLTIPYWSLLIASIIVVLLWTGKYPYLQILNRIMMLCLTFVTVIAFIAAKPPLKILPAIFKPSIPPGSQKLVAAIIGWMPTGVIVSVWHSLWFLEQKNMRKTTNKFHSFKEALLDMRIGYFASMILAVMFVSLGAIMLFPRGEVPQKTQVAVTISKLFTPVLGDWMYPVFMTVAFFAMFSTSYTVMDGFPRTFGETWRLIREKNSINLHDKKKSYAYWVFMVVLYCFALISIFIWKERPVVLVITAGVITFLLSPVYYLLNYICVTKFIQNEKFRPSKIHASLAVAGIVIMTVASAIYIFLEFIAK